MSCLIRSHLSDSLILGRIVIYFVLSDCYFRHANSMESYKAKTFFLFCSVSLLCTPAVFALSMYLLGSRKKRKRVDGLHPSS